MLQKQEDLKTRKGGGYNTFVIMEGKTRFRILFCGDDEDWAMEVTAFFLSKEIGLVISPKTFGEKCAIYEGYEEMKNSKSEDDRKFASTFKPSTKWLAPAVRYKDEDGKELDSEAGMKPLVMAKSAYEDALDLWLDKENGDFTHPLEGYDLKFTRTGKGKNDTKYGAIACKPTKAPKGFRGPVNLEEVVRSIMPTYKETKALLEKFLNITPEDDEDEPKSKKDKGEKKKKKKKKNRDL